MTIQRCALIAATVAVAGALSAAPAMAKAGKFEPPYTDGAKAGKFDPYTDGARAGKFDPYTDGANAGRYMSSSDGAPL
ncbi:signal peptide protein [Cupriavidus sp. SK-3]|uniref:hypothetical protein n=1 Tax=Cupriavidus sp. SK-3 TaxID=1470558 RepID=UPI00044B72B1|nr:hypothetical protein [Cupriavidus sp. SK-3]KDP88135.1 signal peptide protein [Cupriavidus sp. SK-3]